MKNHAAYVYILRCADNTLYTGYTTDINRRLKEHQKGSKKCKYTLAHSRRPVVLASCWATEEKGSALRIEAFIKKMTRTKKMELLQHPETLETLFEAHFGTKVTCYPIRVCIDVC